MTEFFYRTEDIGPSEILDYFVETEDDRSIVNQLKGRNPTVLIGSRGVGKSFLMRVAEQELLQSFESDKVVPVFITFVTSSLLRTNDPEQFRHWMLARICTTVIRTVSKLGLSNKKSKSAKILAGEEGEDAGTTELDSVIAAYENSWKNPAQAVPHGKVPEVEAVKDALEDLAEEIGASRFALFMDEAAHIFLPSQQRQFFTLFRDLRSHCITCNAAVYPGVTNYGDAFQPTHDANMVSVNRNILNPQYVASMRRIVEKQAESALLRNIAHNEQNFGVLAYAASGNPRILLKTLTSAPKVNSSEVNTVIREFYRDGIWSEHSALSKKYSGHREIIDWGRNFLEEIALPDLKSKNDTYLAQDKNSTAFVWVHRDAPEIVHAALRILCYTGVLSEHSSGIKATRSEIGTRYIVNLGCLFALESAPTSNSFLVARSLTPKRMAEFGANHTAFSGLIQKSSSGVPLDEGFEIAPQLQKPNDVLDLTVWQKSKLNDLNLYTVGDVFSATEDELKVAPYVGDKRARRMRNAAVSSVLEYLSG